MYSCCPASWWQCEAQAPSAPVARVGHVGQSAEIDAHRSYVELVAAMQAGRSGRGPSIAPILVLRRIEVLPHAIRLLEHVAECAELVDQAAHVVLYLLGVRRHLLLVVLRVERA